MSGLTQWILTGFEVLALASVIYIFIRFLQQTRGSGVLKGFVVMTIILALSFVAQLDKIGLKHLKYIADRGLSLFLITLVVLFQPELRQALVKLGETRFIRTLNKERRSRSLVDEVTQAADRLSRRELGAIIVIERSVGISGFTEGGVQLDSIVSSPLLVTIFVENTPLHDGAVVIRGKRIVAAGCVLPLSDNPNLSTALGTRHRAALGVTEESDCIAIVVSEETSRISIAQRGQLEIGVTLDRLREVLTTHEEEKEEGLKKATKS